ncbi:hypothetical protein FB451DRAFT_700944 [Mycena latifolia]|nr:hypothetical protein FB451DRAFT_700944 [Mycena latifolia]
MENLRLLPNLRSAAIEMCFVAAGENPDSPLPSQSKLKLENLTFYNNSNQVADWWFRGLCPDTLRDLDIDTSLSRTAFLERFVELQPFIPCLPNVQTLRIVFNGLASAPHLIALRKFPAVKSLTLANWLMIDATGEVQAEVGSSGLCPLLTDYTGSCTLLHLLPFSGLRRLIIDEWCNTDMLLFVMRSISNPHHNNIVHLEISFPFVDASLCTLGDLFPELLILVLTIKGPNVIRELVGEDYGVISDFMKSPPSSLPSWHQMGDGRRVGSARFATIEA